MFAIYEDPLGEYEDFDPEAPDFKARDGPFAGIVIRAHPNCEPIRLTFSPFLELESCTKTQFAPFEIHADIVKLLRIVERHMSEFRVLDESDFWDSGDETEAREAFAKVGGFIDALDESLKKGLSMDFPLPGSDEEGDQALD